MSETVECKATQVTYVSTEKPTTPLYAAAKSFPKILGSVHHTMVYTALPPNLAGRQVLEAYLELTLGYDGGGSTLRETSVQRHAKPATSYALMTWNNKPPVLPGSVAVSVNQALGVQKRLFDVTDDLQAIEAGGAYYGWRVTTTYTAHSWAVYGLATDYPPKLIVVLGDFPAAPTGLAPAGLTALAKPTFTWTAPDDMLFARLQIDEAGGDFSTPLFDSGAVATTRGEMKPGDMGWAGLADGDTVLVRVRQTNDMGDSDWSLPVEVTRDTLTALAVTSPGSTTTDPTPGVVWSFTGQTHWQVTVSLAGKTIHDTGLVAGTDTAFIPPKGATKSGQQLSIRVRAWDATARTPSPGDPGYAETTIVTTYTPGTAPAVTSLTATQDGVRPWVDLAFARTSGLPDEWFITRDGEVIARIPAVDAGDPVWTFRDWTCPPNRDVTYGVRPIVAGAAGAAGPSVPFRSVVDGAWLIDPETGDHFSISGDNVGLAYAESSVWYEPTGGSRSIKRTFAVRGLEGTVSGSLDDYDDRTMEEQEADLNRFKSHPALLLRYVGGDVNVPVVVSDLNCVIDASQSFTDNIIKTVSFQARQDGELPFDEITP